MQGLKLLLCVALINALTKADGNVDLLQFKQDLKVFIKEIKLMQTTSEETVRRSFNSGLQQIRRHRSGSQSFNVASISEERMMAMHDHSNKRKTVGLGELVINLNGVMFQTSHGDYKLRMPHTTSTAYGATEEIDYPNVPPAVLAKKSLSDQMDEMRLWFKAFNDGDSKTRDYKDYFKPILCYLEGSWMVQKDVNSKDELHQKVVFNEYTGHKSNNEDVAFLPTRIIEIVNETTPIVAQWDYRILCHPLKKFLHPDRLIPIDDFHLRLPDDRQYRDYGTSAKARFRMNIDDSGTIKDGVFTGGLLDDLMSEVAGFDNYNGKVFDKAFNVEALHYKTKNRANTAKYMRWYASKEKGANGLTQRHKGFKDQHIFMSQNTRPEVASVYVEDGCKVDKDGKRTCDYAGRQRWSYAIPLEIIYLTPLGKWNPVGVIDRGDPTTLDGKKVTKNGRIGGFNRMTAFNGINDEHFFMTPAEFYSGERYQAVSADTPKNPIVGVIKGSRVFNMTSSGVSIYTQNIPGVGFVRMRYPIVPLAEDGKTAYKEIESLKEFVMRPVDSKKIYNETKMFKKTANANPHPHGWFQMGYAMSDGTQPMVHSHRLYLSKQTIDKLLANKEVKARVSFNGKHKHDLTLSYKAKDDGFVYTDCDKSKTCSGRHEKLLRRIEYE